MAVELEHPFTADKVGALRMGQTVSLSGTVFTARDRLHRHLADGGDCPVNLGEGAVYHCGPVVVRREGVWSVRAAGPTTSLRHEAYMPGLIAKHRLRVIIGKGGMGEGTRAACARCGCVYLQAVGGAASLLAARVERVEAVHFLDEFGPAEALWVLQVRNFEAVVTIDAKGRSLHKRVKTVSKRALRNVLSEKRAGADR